MGLSGYLVSMDAKEQDILGEHVATHWYYVSNGRAMQAMLDCSASRLKMLIWTDGRIAPGNSRND